MTRILFARSDIRSVRMRHRPAAETRTSATGLGTAGFRRLIVTSPTQVAHHGQQGPMGRPGEWNPPAQVECTKHEGGTVV